MSIINLPVWKKGATPAELLMQMAQFAQDNPSWCNDLVILFYDQDCMRQAIYQDGLQVKATVYQLEQAKFDLMSKM